MKKQATAVFVVLVEEIEQASVLGVFSSAAAARAFALAEDDMAVRVVRAELDRLGSAIEFGYRVATSGGQSI